MVRGQGDVAEALQSTAHRVAADYFVPHYAHAPMEVPNAVAHFLDGKCEIWTPTQFPQSARTTAAQVLGLPVEDVTVNVTLLGGAFGRKAKSDYVAEAALLSRRVGAPVKVTWTREDEIQHDYYHAICAQHLEAGHLAAVSRSADSVCGHSGSSGRPSSAAPVRAAAERETRRERQCAAVAAAGSIGARRPPDHLRSLLRSPSSARSSRSGRAGPF